MLTPSAHLDSNEVHSVRVAEADNPTVEIVDWRRRARRLASWLSAVWNDQSFQAAGFVFLLTRSLVFLIFVISTHLSFSEPPTSFGEQPHNVRIAIRRYSIPEELRALATRSDGSWYISVARNGYDKEPFNLDKEHNWAFFPLYPLAVRTVAGITGNYRLVGIALSNLFLFIALTLLHKLVLAFEFDKSVANRTIFYVAAFPTSYFFSLPWTTSLFFMVTVAGFLAAKRGNWWLAGLFAGLASATRYNGIFLFPALLIFYWQTYRSLKFRANSLGLLLAPAGLLAFMAYLYAITGNAFAFADAQAAWKVRWGFFLQPLVTFIISPFELSAGWNFRLLNFAAAMLALICGFVWLKRQNWAWAFYIFISVLTPLSTVTLEGNSRYMISVFPIFVLLAVWGRSPLIDQTVRTVFLVMLSLMTAFFGFFFSPALI
ncbi:MAG: mannosyltransferase family protein [Acidobacteriota bacterium]|nr:mannosyltransferase family protein [Acidobacteriota bacterium]